MNLDGSTTRIIIKIDFEKEGRSFQDHQLLIRDLKTNTIKAERDSRVVFKGYPITQDGISYIKSSVASTTETVAKGTSSAMSLFSILIALFSITMAVVMIKLFQLLFFLLFININLPSNASRFIALFRKSILDYFPTFLKIGSNAGRMGGPSTLRRVIEASATTEAAQKTGSSINRYCTPHFKFEENGMTCSAFVNLGSFITQLIIFLVLRMIILLIVKAIKGGAKGSVEEVQAKASGLTITKIDKDKSKNNQEIDSGVIKTFQFHEVNKKQIVHERVGAIDDGLMSRGSPTQRRFCVEGNNYLNKNHKINKENKRKESLEDFAKIQFPEKQTKNKLKEEKQVGKKSCFKKTQLKLSKIFNSKFFFNLLKGMQLKALMGVMISLVSINPWTTTSGMVNATFSILVIMAYLGLVILLLVLVGYQMKKVSQPSSKTSRHIESLIRSIDLYSQIKELKMENRWAGSIIVVSIAKDFILPLALTIFVNQPIAQISVAMLLKLVSIYVVIKHLPFNKGHINLLQSTNSIIYVLILIVFLISHLTESKMSEKTRFNYIGFGVIGLISLLIVINLAVLVWVIFVSLYNHFTGNKKKKNQQAMRVNSIIELGEQSEKGRIPRKNSIEMKWDSVDKEDNSISIDSSVRMGFGFKGRQTSRLVSYTSNRFRGSIVFSPFQSESIQPVTTNRRRSTLKKSRNRDYSLGMSKKSQFNRNPISRRQKQEEHPRMSFRDELNF